MENSKYNIIFDAKIQSFWKIGILKILLETRCVCVKYKLYEINDEKVDFLLRELFKIKFIIEVIHYDLAKFCK